MKTGDSSGGIGNSAPVPLSAPIKMAEFRYGREEMLALFDRTILPPDPLKQMQGLFVKEMQLPLALIQMTEEETRMWNRGINSDAALRLSKPGVPGGGPGGPRGAMGGRGGSVDRGRGRARGSYHYSRGLSYDDSENTNGYARGRNNYDRSQSGSGWGERNGGDTGDSPRKEFGSRSLSDTNWRRHRVSGGEEDDGWRASRPSDKWGRGNSNSWREGEGWERGSRPWEETNNSHPPQRKPWDSEESNLPEWAMENPSESGGSFDASGAFHGGTVYSDEEETNSGTNHQRGSTRSEQSKSSTSQPRPAPQSKKEPPNITNGTSSSQETGAGDRDSSNVVPLRQSHSASSLATERRPPSLPHPITTSASFSGVNSHQSLSAVESKPQREQPVRNPTSSPLEQHTSYTNYIPPKPVAEPKAPQKPSHEDEMEQRLLNDADVFVSRLMEEEDGEHIPSPSNTSPSHPHPNTQSPIPNPNSDIRWVYQDPQGEIQGNFSPIEMTEWYSMGYFKPSLLVRRTVDEVFLPISEMKKFWKPDKPFEVDYHTLPPIKKNQPPLLQQSLPPAAPPTPALDESILLQYQLHQQLVHQRQQAIFARLSQTEQFNSLSALEQRQLVAQQASLASMETLQGGLMLPHLQQHAANPPTNSNVIAVLQMLAAQQQQQQQQQHQQLQQQRLGAGGVPVQVGLPPTTEPPLDHLQQIMSQIGLQGSARPPAPATPQNTPEDQRSFDQFLNSFRQRQATAVQPQPQPQPPLQPQSVVMESVWGGPASAPAFPGWSVPPGHPPATAPPQSLWADPISKGIKTEADILEEQLRAEEKKKEELRKQEELLRSKQEEEEERERLRRIKEEEELERKRQEEEERERERERKRIQEAEERKKKEAAAAKKAEQDRLRKEEEKKRKEEEKRRKEEEKRKQEEEKKKADEERKRQEEEKKKQEEMAKRQNEALKRIQEQQQAQAQAQARAVKAAPTPAPWTSPEPTGPSLADIQKTERKQQQQLREQQEMLRVYQEKHQQQQQQLQLKNSKSASGLNLKWAETPNPVPTRVKSLAEIQAEEQERMAKQAEKEKAERMAASKDVPIPATGSIWQSATQSLSWNSNSPTSSVWGPMPVNSVSSGGARFFDEERNKPATKPQAQAQAKPQAKTKAKKEEATVMKLFEKQLSKTAKTEEFNKWCTKVLHDANNVDIPTFIDFLWTVESQADIQEYSQPYLDEPRKAAHFAAEFMLRRQRLLTNNPQAEVRQEPPPPPAQPSNNFQEVKGKNKKLKKKNMTKLDSRILGFNVTAAPDRINVGDRDYGENI